MKFLLISDNHDTLVGMRLAGIRPLIVEIPDRHTSAGRSAGSITKYIKDAIGVNLD